MDNDKTLIALAENWVDEDGDGGRIRQKIADLQDSLDVINGNRAADESRLLASVDSGNRLKVIPVSKDLAVIVQFVGSSAQLFIAPLVSK